MRTMAMLVGLLLAAGAMAQEQEEPVRRNVLSLDVINPTWSRFAVSGERVLSGRVSVQLGVGVTLVASHTESEYDEGQVAFRMDSRALGLELLPAARVYLLGRAPVGLWVGPQLGVGVVRDRWTLGREGNELTGTRRLLSVRGAALAGYSAALGRNVVLQAAVGVGAFRERRTQFTPSSTGVELVEALGPQETSTWEVRPTTQLSVGWAF